MSTYFHLVTQTWTWNVEHPWTFLVVPVLAATAITIEKINRRH